MSKKFIHCHYSNGLMWCLHRNGKWAPPFPVEKRDINEKDSSSLENKDESSSNIER